MSFETKHERKQRRRNKLNKEFRDKKFRMYGDVDQKTPYKRKEKNDIENYEEFEYVR